MLKLRRSRVARYGAAAVAALLALLVQQLLLPVFGVSPNTSPFMASFAAVVVAAWFGGLGPGLFATALSTLFSWYFFLAPQLSFELASFGQGLRLIVFALEGAVISWLVESMHAARRRVEESSLQAWSSQESLRASEERYRSLVAVSPQLVWMTNAAGDVDGDLFTWRAYTGQSREDIQGLGWLEALHPDDRERTLRNWSRAVERRSPYEAEYRLRRRDGVYRTFIARGVPVLRDDDSVREWVGTCTDITDRKRAEEALRQSEERFRATFEQAAVGMAQVDLDGRWLRINRKLSEIVGHPHEELLQMTFQDITHPDDLEMDLQKMEKLLAGEIDTYSIEKRYFRKDGSTVWINLTTSLVRDPSGEPAYFISVIQDITERRRAEEALRASEERYRVVIEQSTDGIYLLDADTKRILETNPALQEMLGYAADELEGLEIYDLIAVPREETDLALRRTLEEGRRMVGERRYRRKGGSLVDVEVGVSVVHYSDRVVVCAVLRDITGRKRAEEALREVREAERNRIARDLHDGVLQDLSYTVQSMEVTRIKLEDTGVESELENEIDHVRQAVRGLREAIYDLRVYNHADRSINQLLESLADLNRQRMPHCELELDVQDGFLRDLSERLGLELLRIIQEALTNVRRHSAARHARIRLGAEDDHLVAEVSDDGRGFDAGAPQGIGLRTMHERARALGGRLEVKSGPGEGTTVRFEVAIADLSG